MQLHYRSDRHRELIAHLQKTKRFNFTFQIPLQVRKKKRESSREKGTFGDVLDFPGGRIEEEPLGDLFLLLIAELHHLRLVIRHTGAETAAVSRIRAELEREKHRNGR